MSARYLALWTCFWSSLMEGCRERAKELFSQGTMWNVKVGPEVLDFTCEVQSQGNTNYHCSWPHLSLGLMSLRGELRVHLYLLFHICTLPFAFFIFAEPQTGWNIPSRKTISLLTEHFWHHVCGHFPHTKFSNSPDTNWVACNSILSFFF